METRKKALLTCVMEGTVTGSRKYFLATHFKDESGSWVYNKIEGHFFETDTSIPVDVRDSLAKTFVRSYFHNFKTMLEMKTGFCLELM